MSSFNFVSLQFRHNVLCIDHSLPRLTPRSIRWRVELETWRTSLSVEFEPRLPSLPNGLTLSHTPRTHPSTHPPYPMSLLHHRGSPPLLHIPPNLSFSPVVALWLCKRSYKSFVLVILYFIRPSHLTRSPPVFRSKNSEGRTHRPTPLFWWLLLPLWFLLNPTLNSSLSTPVLVSRTTSPHY